MGSRLEFQTLLEGLLGSDSVYFQPPPTIQMVYPCILYQRSRVRTTHADNGPYSLRKEYTVTVIDANPDSSIPDKLANLSTASHDRHFKADNLNHDVFTIYF